MKTKKPAKDKLRREGRKRRRRKAARTLEKNTITTGPGLNRSAVTNGNRSFHKHEAVSFYHVEARRWRDLHRIAFEASGREQSARTYASLSIERERMDAALARGEAVDRADLIRLGSLIVRLERDLGITDHERARERQDREALLPR